MTPPIAQRLTVQNTAAEEAPAYAALQLQSCSTDASGRTVATAAKPTGSSTRLGFNGRSPIAPADYGTAVLASHGRVLCSASAGQEVGPVSGSWALATSAATKTHVVIGQLAGGTCLVQALGSGAAGPPGEPGAGADETKVVRIVSNTEASTDEGAPALAVAGNVFKAELVTWGGAAWVAGAAVRVWLAPATAGATPKATHQQILLGQKVGTRTESGVGTFDLYAAQESVSGSGELTPCWVTTGCAVATQVAGILTAQTVTVYLDERGSSAGQREPTTGPQTAYWDSLDDPVQVSEYHARRGVVARTTLGTLDLLFVSCEEHPFELPE